MTKYKSFIDSRNLYFVTTSLLNKDLKFLNKSPYSDLILENLNFFRKNKRARVFAFVIMPNHLHLIAEPLAPYDISRIMHSFKSYSSTQLKKLIYQNDSLIWTETKKAGGKIWQEGFFDENIYSQEFLNQKIEYIHNNPIAKNWSLVGNRSDYKYSSASYYDLGINPPIEVDDVEVVLKGE